METRKEWKWGDSLEMSQETKDRLKAENDRLLARYPDGKIPVLLLPVRSIGKGISGSSSTLFSGETTAKLDTSNNQADVKNVTKSEGP